MRSDAYREFFTADNMMGPNSLRLIDELLAADPQAIGAGDRVMDLGCGKGMTSLFVAKETGAAVHAVDLWISEAENRERFAAWGMQEQLIAVNADANALPFEKDMFDALVSVDSYHYYGTAAGFFAQKILPLLRSGGAALIAVPGMKDEFAGRSGELLGDWLGDEAYMFRSPSEWQAIIGEHADIAQVRTWEMESFEMPWQEWFTTGHEFAQGDKRFYNELIRPYTCFVGIMVKKA